MTYTYDYPRPAVTVDAVVIDALNLKNPRVLLIRRINEPFAGCWALPGGFLEPDETLARAAQRELYEETGFYTDELKQLHAFSDPTRDPRDRVITVAFVVKVYAAQFAGVAGSDAAEFRWFAADELPPLAFDHDKIISMALATL